MSPLAQLYAYSNDLPRQRLFTSKYPAINSVAFRHVSISTVCVIIDNVVAGNI